MQGVIKTPNYPKNYPERLQCTWKIEVPKGHTVTLVFLHFFIERNVGCSNDYVKVYDGGNTQAVMIGKYCGGLRPFKVLATSNQMTVSFTSDSSLTFSGFKAQFTAVPNKSKYETVHLPSYPHTPIYPLTPTVYNTYTFTRNT